MRIVTLSVLLGATAMLELRGPEHEAPGSSCIAQRQSCTSQCASRYDDHC